MLSTKNLKFHGFQKWLPKFLGPFKILEAYGTNAFKLSIPNTWRIHDVFNISLLKAYKPRSPEVVLNPDQIPAPPALLDSYVIDFVVDHDVVRRGRNTYIYFIRLDLRTLLKNMMFGSQRKTYQRI